MKTGFDSAPDDEDEIGSFTVTQLAPRLPFQVSFRLPFSRNRVNIGCDSLEQFRRRTPLNSEDADAHITLAAHLLSEQPVLPGQAGEAVAHLAVALVLMPPDDEIGNEAQRKAMVHQFLGDAWIIMGQRAEARSHWEQAVALDPVAPPYGFTGRAQEMLTKYPLE
jgi:tetratricopeptide (TPR) repeat protein